MESLACVVVAVALFLPGPEVVRAGLVMLTLAEAIRAARRHAWQEGRGGVRQIVVDVAGHVEIVSADGGLGMGRLVDGSFVAPWLAVVRWRPEGARLSRAVVIAPDAVDAEAFRRLRVLLRWR